MAFHRLFFILLILFQFEISHAAFECRSFFDRIRQILPAKKSNYSFVDENEKLIWQDLVSESAKYKTPSYLMMSRETNAPILWFMWQRLPSKASESILRLLSQANGNQQQIRSFIATSLKDVTENSSDSNFFFETILSAWLSERSTHEIDFLTWVAKHTSDYEQKITSDKNLKRLLEEKYNWAVTATAAREDWAKNRGVQTLKVSRIGVKDYVEILENFYPIKVNAATNSVRIQVPRARVHRAAWNPISREILAQKASEGFRQLSEYPGFLAADGFFYLSDGNHRFTLDDRENVWIEMSYPIKTSSMLVSFDAMGIPQPSLEDLILLYRGEKSFSDVMKDRREVIYFR